LKYVREAADIDGDDAKIICFVNIKKTCDVVARNLSKNGFKCTVLHGGKKQDEREHALETFKNGTAMILVATDVAGRGIDVKDVTLVLNYDMPDKIDKYCHRIGRTGRAGKTGVATTLLTEYDEEVFWDLKNYLLSTESQIPKELAMHQAAKAAPGTRNEQGKLIAEKRKDTIMYSNK